MSTLELLQAQRAYFQSGVTRDYHFRLNQLDTLKRIILKHEERIAEALKTDLNKSFFEAYETEIGIVLMEISHAQKHLKKWMKPQKVKTPFASFPGQSRIYHDPYGVVLIMSPWNYPFLLTISPLVGAIAAGNCAILKPGSYSEATARIMDELIREAFDPRYISVVLGGRAVNTDLLQQQFDCIFFTGSVNVGKTVMSAAARYLTPVILELGGKSPCIVDETADLDLAAKRIAWGKCINSGQTCIAPDYLLVQEKVKDKLLEKLKQTLTSFWGQEPQNHPDYPKIINPAHFERLAQLLKSGKIYCGGQCNLKDLKIAPTLLDAVDWDSPVMQEEIFGPILPVLSFSTLKEVSDLLQEKPKPLALYLFTSSKENEQFIMNHVSFGGGGVNETLMHMVTPYLPFGGVGNSGMGHYHGKYSFEAFSHQKSVLKKWRYETPTRYAPYSKNHLKILKMVMK
ncbi:MAG: aldehyde dehydrogenase [Erysipelotrichaceae bacterium]|jgi:aldehyde dehydrogenase (NAD+)|nr:aldehyde dehydrogenase [Erysipelotrichaceae bacterium]